MTPADIRRAERLAPAIAAFMRHGSPRGHRHGVDRGVDIDRSICTAGGSLCGEQQRGWSAGLWSRRSVGRRTDPPGTVDGWAGWLAAHIAWGML